jgi:transposase
VQATLLAMGAQETAIDLLEGSARTRVKLRPAYRHLLSVSGIGTVLGLTIMLETGEIGRFAQVGHYASYWRCVVSVLPFHLPASPAVGEDSVHAE